MVRLKMVAQAKELAMAGRTRILCFVSVTCLLSLCVNVFFLATYQYSNWLAYSRHYIEQLIQNETKVPFEPHLNICRKDPPMLYGPLAGWPQNISPETLVSLYPDMKKGRLRPPDCVARERLAIIIPYRNRYTHLHVLLNNLIPFLTRQQADVTFFVVEQAPPETFNRGALLNVGFLEAEKLDRYDCFIFHDADLIPLDDRHMYKCGDNPRHFAVAMNKYNFLMPYGGYFGGIVGFSRQQFLDVNGCSNVYFGWGGEDDDLNYRVLSKGYNVSRSSVNIARYNMVKHGRDKGNEDNPARGTILSTAKTRQDMEGLNTLRYRLNSIEFHHLYTWINVSLNETEILQSAPPYISQAVQQARQLLRNNLHPATTTETSTPVRLQFRHLDRGQVGLSSVDSSDPSFS